jgi:hypothetical protein
MKVQELINLLQKCDPDLSVFYCTSLSVDVVLTQTVITESANGETSEKKVVLR